MASRPALAPFDAIRDWERFDADTETCETVIFHPGCFCRANRVIHAKVGNNFSGP